MVQEIENYPYGDEFNSIKELDIKIRKREKSGITNLSGSAVYWPKTDKDPNYPYERVGVRILKDGSISFAHAEDL